MSNRSASTGRRIGAAIHDEEESLYSLELPERLCIWASRHYLWSALRNTPVPEFVVDAFDNAGAEHLYYALDRVLVCLLAAPTVQIVGHEVRCPCLSHHERVLVTALTGLSRMDEHAYRAAMGSIMLPSAVSVCESAMRLLATGLPELHTERLAWLMTDDEIVIDALGTRARAGKRIN